MLLHHWSSAGLCITPLKHLLKLMLIHPNLGLQARKLPDPIDLRIIMLVSRMAVALQLHFLPLRCRVHNVRGAQLVVANYLVVGDALPAGRAEEMLGRNARVTEEVVVSYHGHEVCCRHGGPAGFADVGVVDEEGGGDDGAEAGPVLVCGVSRDLKFEDGDFTFAS